MHIRMRVVGALIVGIFTFVGLSLAQAQNAPPAGGQGGQRGPGGPGGQGGGDRQRFDPEQMRQRFMEQIKETLAVGDKEWGAIQPALEEVTNLAREAGGGGRMFFGRRGGRPGAPPDAGGQQGQPQSAAAKAAEDLRTTLENKNATPDEIKAKVTALREAREKAKKELTTSKEALREMLTPWQEAQLILMGILD
jgi:Spy/CpxP family protein refolding chaperone